MRIAQVITDESHWGELGPETLKKGLGGRETALVSLAQAWAADGHEVINFVPRDSVVAYKHESGGEARYCPQNAIEKVIPCMGADALVMWECPEIISLTGIREMVGFACVEMQVAHVGMDESTLGEIAHKIDRWCVLSEWAGRFLNEQSDHVSEQSVLPNGVDLTRWDGLKRADQSDPDPKFFYSSSPDRGLAGLLEAWPLIREGLPGAELSIAYGIENWAGSMKWSHGSMCEDALTVIEKISQPGVKYLGKIGQDTLAKVQAGSHALLYPCDPIQPTETGCITAVEAGASDSVMILSDADCLGEDFAHCSYQVPLPLGPELIATAAIEAWKDHAARTELCERGKILAEERSWDLIARQWIEMFEEGLG